jgi:hypothetical protein
MQQKEKNGQTVVWIAGGLGNQMFHYALYRSLMCSGANVSFDISWYSLIPRKPHETFKLNYFKIKELKIIDFNECIKMIDLMIFCNFSLPDLESLIKSNLSFKYKILVIVKKIVCRIVKQFTISYRIKRSHIVENKGHSISFYNKKGVYLQGNFQSYKIFSSIREILLSDFSFDFELSTYMKKIIEDIALHNSVSVHIRRRDYVGVKEFDVCSIHYYLNSINYLKSKYMDLKFYLFSDDKDWVKTTFSFLESYCIIDTSSEKYSDYCDLFLMTKTDHNIIANSSFSWWGAWLNQNPDKMVVVPEQWFKGKSEDLVRTDDVCPPEWIRIASE